MGKPTSLSGTQRSFAFRAQPRKCLMGETRNVLVVFPVVFAINNDPRGIRAGREPEPPGRQSDRCELLDLRAWSKATGADARDGAKGYRLRRPRAPDLSDLRAVHQRY